MNYHRNRFVNYPPMSLPRMMPRTTDLTYLFHVKHLCEKYFAYNRLTEIYKNTKEIGKRYYGD